MTDNPKPAWLAARDAASLNTARLIRAQISTLDDDAIFFVEFDTTGERATGRFLCRKVGDASNYKVQLSWGSFGPRTRTIDNMTWRDAPKPYPPSNCNETMRLIPIEPDRQAALAMLTHHNAAQALADMCDAMHLNALLCREQG